MTNAIQIGPLLLPTSLLLVLVSVGCSLFIGNKLAQGSGVDLEVTFWQILLVGFVAARLGFVWEYWKSYTEAPLHILDIRDGGWSPLFGFIGAGLFAMISEKRLPELRKPLRRALLTGTAIWAVGSAALSLEDSTGESLPPLAFTSVDGASVQLDQFLGKPTAINLWATWCPPCVREMPALHRAQAAHPEVNFVFLNQGEDPKTVQRWLRSQRLTLENVLIDERRQASAAFDQKGYPTTLFFDARGRLVSTRVGELSTATLEERLRLLAR